MKEFMEKFYETKDMWGKLLERVDDWAFGDAKLDNDLFADAMRGAFEVFSEIRSYQTVAMYTEPQEIGVNHIMSFWGTISEYAADRYIVEINNVVFRASQYAVRLLLNGVKGDSPWHDNGVLPIDEILDYYCWREDDKEYIENYYGDSLKDYVYDINKGDLSDFITIAKDLT